MGRGEPAVQSVHNAVAGFGHAASPSPCTRLPVAIDTGAAPPKGAGRRFSTTIASVTAARLRLRQLDPAWEFQHIAKRPLLLRRFRTRSGIVGVETDNQRRWTRYSLPAAIAPHHDLFSATDSPGSSPDSTGLPTDSTGLQGDSAGLKPDSTGSDTKAGELKAVAARVAGKGKVPKAVMEATILELCQGRFLTLAELATLLDRSAPNLRTAYITPLIQSGRLRHRYPEQPNRPDQAYTAAPA